jgi:hypothetical protein
MKTFIAILFLTALPVAAMSQQSSVNPSDGKDCPLSHWSTTGAACFYAPDLPDPEEAGFKLQLLPTSPNKQGMLRYSVGVDSSSYYLFTPTTVPDSISNPLPLHIDSIWNNLKDDPMMRKILPR